MDEFEITHDRESIARLQFLRTHEHLISPWAFNTVERKSRDYELLATRFNGVEVVQSAPSLVDNLQGAARDRA